MRFSECESSGKSLSHVMSRINEVKRHKEKSKTMHVETLDTIHAQACRLSLFGSLNFEHLFASRDMTRHDMKRHDILFQFYDTMT